MKLLHVGDVHLRDGAHLDDVTACLHAVIEIVESHHVDAILIPGDIYETKSGPTERATFREWLERLRTSFDGPVIICKGNHDAPQDLAVWDIAYNVHVFERPDVVTLVRAPGTDFAELVREDYGDGYELPAGWTAVDVVVVPWPEKAHLASRGFACEGADQAGGAALDEMIRMMAATRPDTDRPLVIMGHLSVTGAMLSSAQPLIGREIQIGAGQLAETGACYVALNHIHKHQELAPGLVYAGSLSCHDFGEQDEPKGVVLVETDDGEASWEFISVPARQWHTVEANVEPQGILELLGADTLHDTDVPGWCEGANIRYRYRCSAEDQHLFDHAEIQRRFSAAHSLKIVPVVERTERVRAAEVAEAPTVREKLLAWGAATDTSIPDSALDKLEALQAAV
jgi:exonuclease SbcD